MRIASAVPFIGPLLFRRSVRAVVRAVHSGDLQAVGELTGIATECSDAPAREIALNALGSLPSQDAIGLFCMEILMWEDPRLEEFAIAQGYAPSEPGQRALFLYITGQEKAFCLSDPEEHHPLLARGYAAATLRIRERAIDKAQDHRMGPWLARALIGFDPERNAGRWSYREWNVILSNLADEGIWDIVWQLVPLAPPSLAVRVLNQMKASGQVPGGDMRQVFNELLADLPEAWTSPAPDRPLLSITNQDSRSMRLSFSHDGSFLAAGMCDGKVQIWQIPSARLLFSIASGVGSINFLAFTPDNASLIAGGTTGTLSCFAIPSGDIVWHYDDEAHCISSAILSKTGEDVITGDFHGGIIRISRRTGMSLYTKCSIHSSRITALHESAGDKIVAIGYENGTVCCYDLETGKETWVVPGTGDPVRVLAFLKGGECILVVYERDMPVLRDTHNGQPVRTYTGFSGHHVCYALSTDFRITAIGSNDHVLRFWDLQEKTPAAEIPFYNRLVSCMAITPDSKLLACGCNEGTVYYFNIPCGRRVTEFRNNKKPITTCAISPNGTLFAAADGDGAITLRKIPSGEILNTLRRPAGAVTALTTNPNGAILAGTADGVVRLFAPDDGTLIRSIDMYTISISAIATSSNGNYLACAGNDPCLRLWDLNTGSLIASFGELKTTVRCLTFLPRGNTCISGGWDGRVILWSVPDGRLMRTLTGHSSIITCCCTDPEGQILVTGSNDTTVQIHYLARKRNPVVIRDARNEVSSCTISPDGTTLATAGSEPVIRLYRLPEGKALGTISQVLGKPTSLGFCNDGHLLAVGYESGTLAFYAVYDYCLVRTIAAHAGPVTGLCALPGDDRIATSGADGEIRIFRTPFVRPLSKATFETLAEARAQELAAVTETVARQWRFLCRLLSLRFQNEIGLCPVFRDAGIYDIQIVG